MKNRILYAFLGVLLSFTLGFSQSNTIPAEKVGMSSVRLQKITSQWNDYVAQKKLSGR